MNNKDEHDAFKDVASLLTEAKMNDAAAKERAFNRLKYKLETGTIQKNEKMDVIRMKNKKLTLSVVAASVMIGFCGVFATTSYAQDVLQTLLGRFQVGNMEIRQYDKELPAAVEASSAKQQDGSKASETKVTASTAEGVQGAAPAPASEDASARAQAAGAAQADGSTREKRVEPAKVTIKEAREATHMNFPTPTWLSDHYEYVNSVIQGDHMVEVQYKKDPVFMSLLISTGGMSGISTTGEVKTEKIKDTTVYFANGIVIWEYKGFTYELYLMADKDFDNETLGQIIGSLTTE